MLKLLEAMEACREDVSGMVLTVLTGECMGEKALISNGSLVWESEKGGFFSRHKGEIAGLKKSGLTELEGSQIFCDTLGGEMEIVVCGGGHVSIPVIQIGRMMGCQVTALEDRPKFADNARRAGASRVICRPFAEGLDEIEGSRNTYFVIVTRGHRYDQICLEKIAAKEHAYIGMIGSRRRVALVKENLAERGVDKQVLERVYTPIGLKIGAQIPAEIGVAIMAEIIEVKNQTNRTCGYPHEIVDAVRDRERYPGAKALATIVSRKGSAPQGIGTKMLVLSDGNCIGTIGGGCMEAEVLRKALLMLREDSEKFRLCRVDLTGADVEEEGMVCGGMVDVLLERV